MKIDEQAKSLLQGQSCKTCKNLFCPENGFMRIKGETEWGTMQICQINKTETKLDDWCDKWSGRLNDDDIREVAKLLNSRCSNQSRLATRILLQILIEKEREKL